MKKLLEKTFKVAYDLTEKYKALKIFYTPLEALDSFFLRKPIPTVGAPHIRDAIDLKRYMIMVVVAIFPAMLAGVYFYGLRTLVVIALSYIFGLTTEWLFAYFRKEEINEGAFVTCMIYPLILPPTIPLWMVPVGIIFATVFAKEAFGGTGRNIFNVAMVGRLFLAVAFPSTLTTMWNEPFTGGLAGFAHWKVDAITSATPLIAFKGNGTVTAFSSLFYGNVAGCIGETSKLLIILGGVFLMLTKVANWRLVVGMLGSVAVFSGIGHLALPSTFAPPAFQLLTGGLLFGAMFMITDPVTAPFTVTGKWLYSIAVGLIVVIIRNLSGYVEGVMFAIIFMNIFAPLIDHLVLQARYKEVPA